MHALFCLLINHCMDRTAIIAKYKFNIVHDFLFWEIFVLSVIYEQINGIITKYNCSLLHPLNLDWKKLTLFSLLTCLN